jgi:hypothetical protein
MQVEAKDSMDSHIPLANGKGSPCLYTDEIISPFYRKNPLLAKRFEKQKRTSAVSPDRLIKRLRSLQKNCRFAYRSDLSAEQN